jgi:lactoylglutathione lyase
MMRNAPTSANQRRSRLQAAILPAGQAADSKANKLAHRPHTFRSGNLLLHNELWPIVASRPAAAGYLPHSAGDNFIVAKIIHCMIRVYDLELSLHFYANALGVSPSHRLDFPAFSLVYLRNKEDDFEIELTWNKGRESAYAHGDGYGHIAVGVPNLESEYQRLTGLGIKPTQIKELKRSDELLARFFFIEDPDGYKIEVLERIGHYI